jgi:tetratricopeptide (TPR) repeat protein
MSQHAFARELADRLAYPQLTPATLRAWEQGKATPPSAAVHAALSLVEGSAAAVAAPRDHRGTGSQAIELDVSAPPVADIDHPIVRIGDLTAAFRRALMISRSDAAHLGAATIARFSAVPSVSTSRKWLIRHVDDSRSDVPIATPASLASAFSAFQDLDTRQGGGLVRHALTGYLSGAVLPQLDLAGARRLEPGVRLGLSELLYLTGLTAFDAGSLPLAQAYFIHALRLADDDGAQPFAANIMAAMSHLAVTAGQPRPAIQLATAGLIAANATPIPALSMRLYLMQARGHALLHNSRACGADMRLAQVEHEIAVEAEAPPWARYLDEAYLAGELSLCYRDLDQPRQAIRWAERSIDASKHRVRRRLLSYATLASAHAHTGELDHAYAAGHRALDLLDHGIRSWRGQSELLRFSQQLTPAHDPRGAREFNERLHDLTN